MLSSPHTKHVSPLTTSLPLSPPSSSSSPCSEGEAVLKEITKVKEIGSAPIESLIRSYLTTTPSSSSPSSSSSIITSSNSLSTAVQPSSVKAVNNEKDSGVTEVVAATEKDANGDEMIVTTTTSKDGKVKTTTRTTKHSKEEISKGDHFIRYSYTYSSIPQPPSSSPSISSLSAASSTPHIQLSESAAEKSATLVEDVAEMATAAHNASTSTSSSPFSPSCVTTSSTSSSKANDSLLRAFDELFDLSPFHRRLQLLLRDQSSPSTLTSSSDGNKTRVMVKKKKEMKGEKKKEKKKHNPRRDPCLRWSPSLNYHVMRDGVLVEIEMGSGMDLKDIELSVDDDKHEMKIKGTKKVQHRIQSNNDEDEYFMVENESNSLIGLSPLRRIIRRRPLVVDNENKNSTIEYWFEEDILLPLWLSTNASQYRTSFDAKRGLLTISIPRLQSTNTNRSTTSASSSSSSSSLPLFQSGMTKAASEPKLSLLSNRPRTQETLSALPSLNVVTTKRSPPPPSNHPMHTFDLPDYINEDEVEVMMIWTIGLYNHHQQTYHLMTVNLTMTMSMIMIMILIMIMTMTTIMIHSIIIIYQVVHIHILHQFTILCSAYGKS